MYQPSILFIVLRPEPSLKRERVWWQLSDFLVVLSQQYLFSTNDYMLAWCRAYFIGLSKSRALSTTRVTRPFSSWEVGSGYETILLTAL